MGSWGCWRTAPTRCTVRPERLCNVWTGVECGVGGVATGGRRGEWPRQRSRGRTRTSVGTPERPWMQVPLLAVIVTSRPMREAPGPGRRAGRGCRRRVARVRTGRGYGGRTSVDAVELPWIRRTSAGGFAVGEGRDNGGKRRRGTEARHRAGRPPAFGEGPHSGRRQSDDCVGPCEAACVRACGGVPV